MELGHRWQSSPDLGWEPDANWHCCTVVLETSVRPWQPSEPGLPEAEPSCYAGSAEDQGTGWAPGRTPSYTTYLVPFLQSGAP